MTSGDISHFQHIFQNDALSWLGAEWYKSYILVQDTFPLLCPTVLILQCPSPCWGRAVCNLTLHPYEHCACFEVCRLQSDGECYFGRAPPPKAKWICHKTTSSSAVILSLHLHIFPRKFPISCTVDSLRGKISAWSRSSRGFKVPLRNASLSQKRQVQLITVSLGLLKGWEGWWGWKHLGLEATSRQSGGW